jgi:hypothetical protein
MKHKIFLLMMVILAVGLNSAYAGNADRIGTAGGQELRIPVGSRGPAMGGSVVANSNGVDAIYWNPAGLANLEGTEAMFTHLPYIADIDVEYFALGTNVEDFGAIGVAVKVLDAGEWEETTEAFPDGTGRYFSPTLTVIGLTYSRALTASVNFGVTGNVIREDIFEVDATGFSFDFGFTYRTKFPGLTLGFAMKNYGPDLVFSGRGFDRVPAEEKRPASSRNAPSELPTSLNIGTAYNFYSDDMNSATVTANFQANNQSMDMWQGGFEYAYNQRYFIRAGYNYSDQDSYLYGASLGAGVMIPVGTTDLTLEYCWTETETFDANQYWTLRIGF